MIKFISADDVLDIRNLVLREGRLRPEECRFPSDEVAGAFHLGYFDQDELVCVASFHQQIYAAYQGKAYQLRGMATLESHRGKSIGNQLLNFAIVYLRGQKANYIWCNARLKALKFYQNTGFEIISDQFEIAGIGPHYVLYLKIQ
ncbi:GNAT family N-acetyltransferase [Mucilaginibacter paludis]|uniref:GCN5-related N-acetyltransferase n=1 Tax=Mucilaginibacter paludis DSM 18603 TaxID=714943 RepID=H1Y1Z2_9SPHI|nr:GNAT family N-acetyltransferase [Mucilaginibacter paludis]EHQ25695.1 GCN5-related N-acetyltransferase [Mucilaginibacter paludis DSM 18603]